MFLVIESKKCQIHIYGFHCETKIKCRSMIKDFIIFGFSFCPKKNLFEKEMILDVFNH